MRLIYLTANAAWAFVVRRWHRRDAEMTTNARRERRQRIQALGVARAAIAERREELAGVGRLRRFARRLRRAWLIEQLSREMLHIERAVKEVNEHGETDARVKRADDPGE